MTSAVYACVWVRRFCTQALLRLRPELQDHAVAVMEGERPAERMVCLNMAAHRMGAVRGMTRAEAELTGVELLTRSTQEEAGTRSALLGLLHRLTPRVEDASRDTHCVLAMDLAGTERLFGSPSAIAQQVIQQAQAIGLRANVAISANFDTAVALASYPCGRIVEVAPGDEAKALASLPIHALPTDADTLAVFEMWGLRTFGEVAALPRPQLVSRLGSKADSLLALTRGERSHLFRPVEVVADMRETMRFDEPIELLEPLMFVMNAMLDALLRRAMTNLTALAGITATLGLDGGGGEHIRRVRPALPTQDRQLLLKLLQLDLNANPPPAGIVSVDLLAETGAMSRSQLGLFCPQHPEPMRMDVAISRLVAMVGEGNVGHPRLVDSNREGEFQTDNFSCLGKKPLLLEHHTSTPALRRLRPPVELCTGSAAPERISYQSTTYFIRRTYGPWRSSGAWWSSTAWAAESWDFAAESEQTELLLGVMTHDRLRKIWQLDALYD